MAKKPDGSLTRSSAVEYLTFVAASGQGGIETVYAHQNVWVSQKMMAQLYGVEPNTINYHLKKVFLDTELQEGSVTRNFWITAADGKSYATQHYNHLIKIFADEKLQQSAVIQDFWITAADGKSYATQHFKRSATIAVVCKVNSRRAVLFLVNLVSSPTATTDKPAQGHQHNKNSQTRKNQGASE